MKKNMAREKEARSTKKKQARKKWGKANIEESMINGEGRRERRRLRRIKRRRQKDRRS